MTRTAEAANQATPEAAGLSPRAQAMSARSAMAPPPTRQTNGAMTAPESAKGAAAKAIQE